MSETTSEVRLLDAGALPGIFGVVDAKIAAAVGNAGRIWKGTQAEYDALASYDENAVYVII